MGRKWLLSLVCLSLCGLLFIPVSNARFELNVNEAATTISFQQLAPIVSLAVENGSDKAIPATIRVELLKPSNQPVCSVDQRLSLQKGKQQLQLTLPVNSRSVVENESQILWYRLHYRILAETSGGTAPPIEGIISLSQITPEFFSLRIAAAGAARPGMPYQVRARAIHPFSHRPASRVHLRGTITITDKDSGKDTVVTASGETDSQGDAKLTFPLPQGLLNDELQLAVDGSRGLLTASVKKDIDLLLVPFILISTDKPLYQPGQTVHTRVTLMSSSKRAMPEQALFVKITDPEDTVIFNTEVKTSRFGIASTDWTIPDNTRLGDYEVEFRINDDWYNAARIKISRYDLPNFVVNVSTDRPFYLPGQKATITAKGDYLFGESVPRGHVRIVRDVERTWNYRLQAYDTKEGPKYEGQLGPDQRFSVQLDLSADFAELKNSDYSKYTDLSYTAYLTDPTTNRTEQRPFTVRVSKEPIHVYVSWAGDNYEENLELEPTLYVTAFYADGRPAECKVTVTENESSGDGIKPRTIATAKTNRYGLAKVDRLSISREAVEDMEVNFTVTARDKDGKVGTRSDDVDFTDEAGIRVKVPKTIYFPDEPIPVTIISSEPSVFLVLEVVREWSVIHSQRVRTHNGTASVLLPYRSAFRNEIVLAAYSDRPGEQRPLDVRSIIYPQSRDLKLDLQSSSKVYKPGEEARFTFSTRSSEGRSLESALGVVVVDKAVEERFRSEERYGYSSFRDDILGIAGYTDSIGTVSRRTIENLDHSKPVSPAMDLAAEILLNQYTSYFPKLFGSDDYESDLLQIFSRPINSQVAPVADALTKIYEKTRAYPADQSTLDRLLSGAGINLASLRDPWGNPFFPVFSIEGAQDVFVLKSAGPDERVDTNDDFSVTRLSWPYFRTMGEAIDRVAESYQRRTDRVIRDLNTLRDELRREGIDLDSLRDRRGGRPDINFEVDGTHVVINITTKYVTKNHETREFSLWQTKIDYFQKERTQIDTALYNSMNKGAPFPQNSTELVNTLKAGNFDLNKLRDPWGNPYYLNFKTLSFRGDEVKIETRVEGTNSPRQHYEIKPVTTVVLRVTFRSNGKDAKEGTEDDFEVATFATTKSTQSASDPQPRPAQVLTTFTGSTGAITGRVTDPNGAVVGGAEVIARNTRSTESYVARTDSEGLYLLRNLIPGIYEIRVDVPGFKALVITHVQVQSTQVLELNLVLEVGMAAEVVTVTGGSGPVQTSSASVAHTIEERRVTDLKPLEPNKRPLTLAKSQISTPRLREFFPETLLWQPELITDKKGRAQLDFKLADNITTWKMAVIGSTENGEVATAETEIRAFQPFFAELDAPKILTQGDRISLPVVLRNYLGQNQSIDLQLRPETWFRILESDRKTTNVPQGDSITEAFDLEVLTPVAEGHQRITALGSEFSDAIQKNVKVHPDGEEKSITTTELFRNSTDMFLDLPAETIKDSARVELKIYPHFTSHLWESVEGIMQRPYGCGEQTISSTYPSLLVLRYLKNRQIENPVAEKARRYLQAGYQRLLGYQSEDGGFNYWGNSSSDIGLTAYAIRFLRDAGDVTQIDEGVRQRAYQWLLKQQRADGSWPALHWNGSENASMTPLLTALVARSVAAVQSLSCDSNSTTDNTSGNTDRQPLAKALDYLERRSQEINEPYLIASYSLAASAACENSRAAAANSRLRSLAHKSAAGNYWALETNTPFYGWGTVGRVETTALVVQALARQQAEASKVQETRQLIDGGLLFLLKQKDRYGVWSSTQATINVLDAMLTIVGAELAQSDSNNPVEVFVNGQQVSSLQLPADRRFIAPITADLSSVAKPGRNQIELKRSGQSSAASAQVVSNYWIPWSHSSSSNVQPEDSAAIRLDVKFDKTEVRVMEEISCNVKAERIGHRGYGMLLAEIGLPPGTDVDRPSLQKAMQEHISICQYDILPDRLVLYLWPRAGGVDFNFKFRPRIRMNAQSASSTLYDYYNPEAKAVVAPFRFVVK